MSRATGIGIDRRLDIEWLDAVAAQVAAGHDVAATRARLFEILDGVVAGGSKRGAACSKTVGVLSRTWANVPAELVPFRDRGLNILPSLFPPERLALHWGMLLAGYRFFGDVAANSGRLLSLQGSLTLSQLTRRLRESWGERSTLNRAAQRAVRSMVQWGVLRDSEDRGVYVSALSTTNVSDPVAELLLEALLINTPRISMSFDQLVGHPAFFPFKLQIGAHHLRNAEQFDVDRQSLDVDVVSLRRTIQTPKQVRLM
jgi:hypothetical protein